MTPGWPLVRLGDVCNINPSEPLKKGTETPFIAMADLAENLGGVQRVGQRPFTGGGARFRAGDLLVARITPCLENGKIARVPNLPGGTVGHGSTEFIVVREQDGVSDAKFLYYLLSSPDFFRYAVPRMTGSSGRQRLATDSLSTWPIMLPPIEAQRAIVEALDSLDSLAAVEALQAERLDELARVQGRRLLAQVGERPLVPLVAVADITKGYSYKSEELRAGNGWLVNLKNIGRDGRFQARGYKPFAGQAKASQVVDNGDVVVAQTDLTQQREVIARPVRVRRGDFDGALTASLDLVIVRPRDSSNREYLFACLDTPQFRTHALGFCNGTTVVHMGSAALPSYQVLEPTPAVLQAFADTVRPLGAAADDAARAAGDLVARRDLLRPLLLSGAVSVGAAEI